MVYDAFVLLSFGGPEKPDDVMPFLRNVVRGRGVPDERLAEVYEHYMHFGGVSPINQQCRDLLAAVGTEFAAHGIGLPSYWGNRNWQPMLADTVAQMRDDGVEHALGFATSAYGGYSSCKQYWEDIAAAREHVGPKAPRISKLRQFHDHPGFVEPHAEAVRAALGTLDPARRATTRVAFTAHSIPAGMARNAGPTGNRYTDQLAETARLVQARAADDVEYDLVWQSRSGPPQIPWLEPDINDHLEALAEKGVTDVVVSPIGFVSDHLEVIWDLDNEAKDTAARLGLGFARAASPGVHPRFVTMVRELVEERLGDQPHTTLGTLPTWDVCPANCCPPAKRPGAAA
ncbi:ferrochelatase [Actinoplanes palleronii]|uniref:Coproporphyrin III ferrochelatase n=1 Tax=Actinoplanes palleronii TaxID=113570 RepID=A0ABQ4BDE6_9ACTN|nr:ferrochelatase [Actinoplanes palleronii]GIE68642.1 ferrochelatase [Actinoplanes palleronii]